MNTTELIKQIHHEFDTAVETISEQAMQTESEQTKLSDLISKRDRLVSRGFTNTIEVQEADKEIERLEGIKKRNKVKNDLAEAVKHFSLRYPLCRFITEEAVADLCEKYNLIYGEVTHYKGTVPDKNLKEIENTRFDLDDIAYKVPCLQAISIDEGYTYTNLRVKKYRQAFCYLSSSDLEVVKNSNMSDDFYSTESIITNTWRHVQVGDSYRPHHRSATPAPLVIAAPKKDFDAKGMKLKGKSLLESFKVQRKIPDPVVMQPVMFKGTKHFLIITAWGDEASDENVIRPINN